ncbi:MAG TPA: SpoIIE family protein phosphatase [Ignavibacteriaceae bacterium]|nr:SpoIIE family protein phosphatase [Ignavibacteriaceae bacterium]
MNKILKLQNLFALVLIFAFFGCKPYLGGDEVKVTFNVVVNKEDGINELYIAGNRRNLGEWTANKKNLERINDSTFTGTFSFDKDDKIEYKFTLGSWMTEALDDSGNIPDNSVLNVEKDTVINVRIRIWRSRIVDGGVYLTQNFISDNSFPTEIGGNWKFSPYDSTAFHSPDYDDTHWEQTATANFPKNSNAKFGWFRMKLTVDSGIYGKAFAVDITHLGASEVYFNGVRVINTGVPSASPTFYKGKQNRDWFGLIFLNQRYQYIAVKYANLNKDYHESLSFNSGFSIKINNINRALSGIAADVRLSTIYQALYTLIPLILFFVHLLLYWFYRKSTQNFYYAICLLGFASLSYCNIQKFIATDPETIILFYRMVAPSIAVSIYFGILTGYSGIYERLPKRRYFYLALSVAVGIWGALDFSEGVGYTLYFLLAASVFEYLFIFFRRKEMTGKINLMISGAFIILLLSIVYQILLDFDIVPTLWGLTMVYGIGLLALILAMSVSLSYDFALTNHSLEKQMEISMQKDWELREREVEKRILEADNQRKTEELESAREQQLAFLPKKIPDIKGYEISVYMQTATEVGGDYYDFYLNEGELTFVLGDATGHGAKAGIMVAATKSLFSVLAPKSEPIEIIKKFNAAIKSMNLHNLYMALSAYKLSDKRLIYSNAGMPPFIHFRASTGSINEIVLKSMPLGGFLEFPYEQNEILIESGDTLLFMSDGFSELFNEKNEIRDSGLLKKVIQSGINLSPEELINRLVSSMKEWNGDRQFNDDVSFIVIKRKTGF